MASYPEQVRKDRKSYNDLGKKIDYYDTQEEMGNVIVGAAQKKKAKKGTYAVNPEEDLAQSETYDYLKHSQRIKAGKKAIEGEQFSGRQ